MRGTRCVAIPRPPLSLTALHAQSDSTPLISAVDKGHMDLARMLVEAGADVNASSKARGVLAQRGARVRPPCLRATSPQPILPAANASLAESRRQGGLRWLAQLTGATRPWRSTCCCAAPCGGSWAWATAWCRRASETQEWVTCTRPAAVAPPFHLCHRRARSCCCILISNVHCLSAAAQACTLDDGAARRIAWTGPASI
jgi:hypothetical protein